LLKAFFLLSINQFYLLGLLSSYSKKKGVYIGYNGNSIRDGKSLPLPWGFLRTRHILPKMNNICFRKISARLWG